MSVRDWSNSLVVHTTNCYSRCPEIKRRFFNFNKDNLRSIWDFSFFLFFRTHRVLWATLAAFLNNSTVFLFFLQCYSQLLLLTGRSFRLEIFKPKLTYLNMLRTNPFLNRLKLGYSVKRVHVFWICYAYIQTKLT